MIIRIEFIVGFMAKLLRIFEKQQHLTFHQSSLPAGIGIDHYGTPEENRTPILGFGHLCFTTKLLAQV